MTLWPLSQKPEKNRKDRETDEDSGKEKGYGYGQNTNNINRETLAGNKTTNINNKK